MVLKRTGFKQGIGGGLPINQDQVIESLSSSIFPVGHSETQRRIGYYRRLTPLWEILSSHYRTETLSLSTTARQLGLSPARLNVLLKEASGLTFHQLLTRFRLYQAVVLMGRRNYGMSELSEAVGFGSRRTFERSFRRILSMTPREAHRAILRAREARLAQSWV